jgi:hypothetical protein
MPPYHIASVMQLLQRGGNIPSRLTVHGHQAIEQAILTTVTKHCDLIIRML